MPLLMSDEKPSKLPVELVSSGGCNMIAKLGFNRLEGIKFMSALAYPWLLVVMVLSRRGMRRSSNSCSLNFISTADANITCDRAPSRSPANNSGPLMIDDSTSVNYLPMIINSQGTNGLLSWDYMDHLDHKDMVDMPKFDDSSGKI